MSIVTKENNPKLYNALFEEETNEVEIMTEEIKEILDCLDLIARNEYVPDELLNDDMCNKLLNYITNLQKENQELKEENKRIFSRVNDDELLISNAMNYAELQDYKSRNEKAAELLQLLHYKFDDGDSIHHNIEDIQKELQGGDEE